MRTSRKHKTKFWTVYAISVAVLVILIGTALGVFYDFIDAFEDSQPQSAAEAATKYAKAITHEELRAMLESEGEGVSWHSEDSKEKFISERVASLDDGGMFCRRSGGDDAHPIYSVISRGHELCRLELESIATGRYSFKCWRVREISAVFDALERYEIAVPLGSTVTLNGELLDQSNASKCECPYSHMAFDSNVPEFVVYTTDPSDAAPSIMAIYEGENLAFESSGARFTAIYPTKLFYSATLRVPQGSQITVRGHNISESVKSVTEDAFKTLITDGVQVPQYDVYTAEGLYTPLEEICISLDGRELEYSVTVDGNTQYIDCKMSVDGSDGIYSFAEDFTRTYFRYTSSGYKNIDENLAATLAYVQPSSELYARIRDSKIGYDFVTPVTSQVYNRLEVTESYLLDDTSYVVVFAFDIDHTIYSESRSYVGELLLRIAHSDNGYTVLNMTIENK